MSLPSEFLDRLKNIVPQEKYEEAVRSFSVQPLVTLRVNSLKITVEEVLSILKQSGICFELSELCPYAIFLEENVQKGSIVQAMIDQGKLYRQDLSSMFPVMIMDPKPGERILDMCAAPGSKASQIAMLMKNKGEIVAVEMARPRYYRLKSVLSLLGVTNTQTICKDAQQYRDENLFDAVLVDAPCSSEGRFRDDDPSTYQYWNLRKIKEMEHKQKGLLLQASRLVRPEGRIIYATCTFAPEENESVIDWFLEKTGEAFSLESISLRDVPSYPAVQSWEKKKFNDAVARCLRIFPGRSTEGFFIAQLKRKY